MTDLEENWQPVRINDDGELIGGLFCAYCGEVNEPGADSCASCGKYIADQGPDLNARLRRIRRYASSVHEGVDEPPQTDLIGSDPKERADHGFIGLLFFVCLLGTGRLDDKPQRPSLGRKRKMLGLVTPEDVPSPNDGLFKEAIRLAVGFALGFGIGLVLVYFLTR